MSNLKEPSLCLRPIPKQKAGPASRIDDKTGRRGVASLTVSSRVDIQTVQETRAGPLVWRVHAKGTLHRRVQMAWYKEID